MTQRNRSDKPAGDKPPSRKSAINKPGGSGSITKPRRRSQLSSRAQMALNEEGFGESSVPDTIGTAVNAPNQLDLRPQAVEHVEEEVDIELVPEVLYDIFGEIPAVLEGQLTIRMPSLDMSLPQRSLAEVSSVPFEQASRISSSQQPITHHGTTHLQASSADRSTNPFGAGPWLNKLRPRSGIISSHAPGHPSFNCVGQSSMQFKQGSGRISLQAAPEYPSFLRIRPSRLQQRNISRNEEGISESLVPGGTIGIAVNATNAMELPPQVVRHVKEEVNIELPPLPEVLIYGEVPAVLEGQPGMRMPWLEMSLPHSVSSFQQAVSRITSSQRPITHHGTTDRLRASSANPSGLRPWQNEACLEPISFFGMGTLSTLQPVPESGISLYAPRHHRSFHASGLPSLQLRPGSGISSYAVANPSFPGIVQPSSIQLRPGSGTSSHAPGGHPSFHGIGQSSMQFRPGRGGIILNAPRHHPSFNALGLPCLQLKPGSGIISSHAPRRLPSFRGIISHAAAYPSFDRIGQSSIQIRPGSGGISNLQAAPEHPSFHGIRPSELQQRQRPEVSINSHAPERASFRFVGSSSNTYDAASALDPLADTADSHQRLRSNPTSVQQNAAPGKHTF